ncbi:MAG: ATP-dependent sacrificial sulfur transferase LarE [Sedimentisphaerales bacterium]|nr:ATP-dependent sacrificial sulfur transferase LarE [Sedimentisphaerales bacterium]
MIKSRCSKQYERLKKSLARFRRVLAAYSGGVDSTLVLRAAVDALGEKNVRACLGVSPLIPDAEIARATATARELGVEVELIERREMAIPAFTANRPDRCYVCKRDIFAVLAQLARERGYDAVLCGHNVDDLNDYRPGNRAVEEMGVVCPLIEAGLSKADVRAISRELGLPTWDKPADPCLATRLAYGLEITPRRLEQVEKAETFVRGVLSQALNRLGRVQDVDKLSLRVRHHGDLARIEAPAEFIAALAANDMRALLTDGLRDLGFIYITLDLQGFRSGSGDETLL